MDSFSEWITLLASKDGNYHWLWQVFCIILGTLFINFFGKRTCNKVIKKLEKTKSVWDDALFHSIYKPFSLLIWIFGFTIALEIAKDASGTEIFDKSHYLTHIGISISVGWFLARFTTQIEHNLLRQPDQSVDQTTIHAISKLLRITILIMTVLVILQILDIPISGVLAFGGIGGVAVGFAAKDLLANFFGGLLLYLDRPFSVGDWIRSPDRNIEGTVEDIGWRLCRIRTFDKRPLYIPNSVFTNIALENPARMTNRRIKETIGVRYEDIHQVSQIVDGIKSMLMAHKEIDQQKTMIVNLNHFNASSVDIFVYTFTITTDWVKFHQVKHDILLNIAKVVSDLDAEIAYPTQTLFINQTPEVESQHQYE